jgi:hypothetical protein
LRFAHVVWQIANEDSCHSECSQWVCTSRNSFARTSCL